MCDQTINFHLPAEIIDDIVSQMSISMLSCFNATPPQTFNKHVYYVIENVPMYNSHLSITAKLGLPQSTKVTEKNFLHDSQRKSLQ